MHRLIYVFLIITSLFSHHQALWGLAVWKNPLESFSLPTSLSKKQYAGTWDQDYKTFQKIAKDIHDQFQKTPKDSVKELLNFEKRAKDIRHPVLKNLSQYTIRNMPLELKDQQKFWEDPNTDKVNALQCLHHAFYHIVSQLQHEKGFKDIKLQINLDNNFIELQANPTDIQLFIEKLIAPLVKYLSEKIDQTPIVASQDVQVQKNQLRKNQLRDVLGQIVEDCATVSWKATRYEQSLQLINIAYAYSSEKNRPMIAQHLLYWLYNTPYAHGQSVSFWEPILRLLELDHTTKKVGTAKFKTKLPKHLELGTLYRQGSIQFSNEFKAAILRRAKVLNLQSHIFLEGIIKDWTGLEASKLDFIQKQEELDEVLKTENETRLDEQKKQRWMTLSMKPSAILKKSIHTCTMINLIQKVFLKTLKVYSQEPL